MVWAQSVSSLYQEAQRVFKSYRYQVEYSDFSLKTYDENGMKILQLLVVLKSGRNRFDEAMLVGFAACGAAIDRTNIHVDRVSVVVKVQYKDEVSIAATADMPDVISLYRDEMETSDFMSRITWY
jgi:hypothetical protein